MTDPTVDQPAAEREPDNVTPCWACNGAGMQFVGDGAEAFECTVCDGTGLSAQHRAKPAVEPEPERRTVSLEVLTDESRAAENARRFADASDNYIKPEPVDPAARVGVVLRLSGEPTAVPDDETDWRGRTGPELFALLMEQALRRAYNDGAELLMPTPDVLAALAGSTAGGAWTALITMRADQLEPGWLIDSYAVEGADALIAAVDDACEDETCPWHGTCIAVTAGGTEPLHVSTWSTFEVRIPCAVTR